MQMSVVQRSVVVKFASTLQRTVRLPAAYEHAFHQDNTCTLENALLPEHTYCDLVFRWHVTGLVEVKVKVQSVIDQL